MEQELQQFIFFYGLAKHISADESADLSLNCSLTTSSKSIYNKGKPSMVEQYRVCISRLSCLPGASSVSCLGTAEPLTVLIKPTVGAEPRAFSFASRGHLCTLLVIQVNYLLFLRC